VLPALPQDKEIALEAVTQIPFACAAELFQRHGRGLGVLEKFASKMSLCDAEVWNSFSFKRCHSVTLMYGCIRGTWTNINGCHPYA
jgi:hypothetical protein